MKQFTTPEQTAKLIELGLPKPKSEVKAEQAWEYAWYNPAYSIGELIEMLPPHIDQIPLDIGRLHLKERWVLCYNKENHGSLYRQFLYYYNIEAVLYVHGQRFLPPRDLQLHSLQKVFFLCFCCYQEFLCRVFLCYRHLWHAQCRKLPRPHQ